MVVNYKRDMNRNYMVIENMQENDYRIKMLCANKIKGLLAIHTNTFNGKMNLYYDISSKQPLSRLYAKKELQMDDMRTILFSLQAVMEEVKKYLLDCNDIILDPVYCYSNPDSEKLEWTCFPGHSETVNLYMLAEFFIERVDHADSEAVELAYHFFREVKNDNLIFPELIEQLIKSEDKNIEHEEISMQFYERHQPELINEPITQKTNGLVDKIKEKIKLLLGNEKNSVERKHEERICGRETYEWERVEEERANDGETVVMGVRGENFKRQLRSRGNSPLDIIPLEHLPCVIGKRKECSDIILDDSSISRIHAKIYEEKGELYLQDLNSTNGSYINGLILENNETIQIKPGDEVMFGNLRYVYE